MSAEESAGELPRDLLDRIFRHGLATPANLRAFLRAAVPEYAESFDCEQVRALDRETFTPNWFSREADLPLEVPFRVREGEEVWALVLVLIEHQSSTDPLLPLRMLFYAVCHWMNQLRQWEAQKEKGGPFRLGPVLPLVLHTGPRAWGSNRDLRGLYAGPGEFADYIPAWGPLFWELSGQDAEALVQTGEGWMQLMALMRAEGWPQQQLHALYGRVAGQLASLAGRDVVHWRQILDMAFRYTLFSREAPDQQALRAAVEAAHPDRATEVQQMTRTYAQDLLDQGRQQGRQEGRQEGELHALRETLLLLVRSRFPEVPEDVEQRVATLNDRDRLKQLLGRILQVERYEDLGL